MRPKMCRCNKEDCEHMKILYLTPDFSNFFAATYDGMITAIDPYCDLTLYGPGYKIFNDLELNLDINDVIKTIYGDDSPDIIIMWDIEGSGWAGDFTGLNEVSCLKVLWTVDLHNDAVPHRLDYIQNAGIDLVLMTYDKNQITHSARFYKELGIPMEFYPFSIDPEMFKPMGLPKKYDVSLVGNMSSSYYPLRNKVHETIKEQGLNYHHPEMGIYVREKFARHINESKICLTGSSSYKYLVQKYYEITACGTLLMADTCMDSEDQHFIPGHNFVEINEGNVLEKVRYYLSHPEESQRIANNGRESILKHHTHDIRAKELMEILHKHV